ncbi:MAG TPA: class I SAM-dependent methyltransferase [Longimicrobium sp.]|uniref:class I SAM-dependent methyltransferase n=1 Tax=Longimicrobium sp. TaxID=2029185 RepID=UPI002ED92EE3
MTDRDALDLLRAAVPVADAEVWADLGAGSGVFTRALATLVGPAGHVFAVDEDDRALAAVRAWAASLAAGPHIDILRADVTGPLALPPLDGIVMANVLHFVADAESVLPRIVSLLRPGGRFVLMEYEGRRPGPWTPYPVSAARFRDLAASAGLDTPHVAAARPSRYGGQIYAAVATRAP